MKTIKKYQTFLGIFLIGFSIMLLGVNSDETNAFAERNHDPRTSLIPQLESFEQDKSVSLHVIFNSRTDVTYESSTVGYGVAHTHLGDPPLIRITLLDLNGNTIEQLNSWHPLWYRVYESDGSHSLEIQESGPGRFVVPYYPNLGAIKISDVALNQDLLCADIRESVGEFCAENSADLSCSFPFPTSSGGSVLIPGQPTPTVTTRGFAIAEMSISSITNSPCMQQIQIPIDSTTLSPSELSTTEFSIWYEMINRIPPTFSFDTKIELSIEEVKDISPNIVRALPVDAFKLWSSETYNRLSKITVEAITPDIMRNIPASTITQWTPDFINRLDPDTKVILSPSLLSTDFSMSFSRDGSPKVFLSPYGQVENDVLRDDVICNEGLELVKKVETNMPVCIRSSTTDILITRGWAVLP